MTSEYSGSGDPQRTLELLWGTQKGATRGPKPGMSVVQIVRQAIQVADAEGLAALSMRRVADALGVGTMSLYTYVPGKAELLDVMLDTVFGEEQLPAEGADWRVVLEARAREDWALYGRHPWVLQVSGARAVLGPHETGLLEATLRGIRATGLHGRELIGIVTLVVGYVRGAAQGALEAARAAERTGVSNEVWWAAREPIFDQYFDAERFPTLVQLHQEGAFDPPQAGGDYLHGHAVDDFAFGLQRVLDGIEVLVRRRRAQDKQM